MRIASRLIAERGFNAVSMVQIGDAAGISGAAVYRHFTNKQDLLAQIVIPPAAHILHGARKAIADIEDPREVLETLVAFHTVRITRAIAAMQVYFRCADSLTERDRDRLDDIADSYYDLWVEPVLQLRPDMDRPAALLAVHAVLRIFAITPDERRSMTDGARGRLTATLARGALDALTAKPQNP